jgi:hypothetical protein
LLRELFALALVSSPAASEHEPVDPSMLKPVTAWAQTVPAEAAPAERPNAMAVVAIILRSIMLILDTVGLSLTHVKGAAKQ